MLFCGSDDKSLRQSNDYQPVHELFDTSVLHPSNLTRQETIKTTLRKSAASF